MEPGRALEAIISGANEAIDSLANNQWISNASRYSGGEIAKERWQIGFNFKNLRERKLSGPKHKFGSLRRVARYVGMDVMDSSRSRRRVERFPYKAWGCVQVRSWRRRSDKTFVTMESIMAI